MDTLKDKKIMHPAIIPLMAISAGVIVANIYYNQPILKEIKHAHSRLNTIYMTTYFIGAAIGTYFGLLSWKLGQWGLSTTQMLVWNFAALLIVIISEQLNRKKAAKRLSEKPIQQQ